MDSTEEFPHVFAARQEMRRWSFLDLDIEALHRPSLLVESFDGLLGNYVPFIPVRSIEAWMLADPKALQTVTETNVRKEDLGLPTAPHQVEAVFDPKQALRKAVEAALGHLRKERREMKVELLFNGLAQTIDLALLEQVPAYREFVKELTQVLGDQHFIRQS